MNASTPEDPSTLPPSNAEIATTLRLLADLLEIGGEPVFRVVAYRRAAEGIDALPERLADIDGRHGLEAIPGVGKGIAEKIEELLQTGKLAQLDELDRVTPRTVAELLAVPDIGPKRAALLFHERGVASLADLRRALDAGTLAGVTGLGPKALDRIAEGLKAMPVDDERMPLPDARTLGASLVRQLREAAPTITRIELAGSVRRFRESVGDLDIVAAAEEPEPVIAAFAALSSVRRVEMHGANRCRVSLEQGGSADLRVLPERHWGSLLHHFTGSKFHNVHLRDIAIERGASMSEYGFKVGEALTPCATEEEVYRFLGLQYIAPPMRENTGEIERAAAGDLPPIVQLADLRGDLHSHSTYSDGEGSIEEMARGAISRGYRYLCVTDHSRGLAVAHGLDEERLRRQREEIDRVNADLAPFRVLQGLEVEVRADGALDLPDDVLARLDILVASVHSGLRRGRESVTARALAAIAHPLVDILAHPTGRILGGRPGGDFDLDALAAAAAENGTILEINGPNMDLRDTHARLALAAGSMLSVDSDAHSVEGLGAVEYAVGVAQRAWAPPERILNTLPLDQMLARLKRNNRGRQSQR